MKKSVGSVGVRMLTGDENMVETPFLNCAEAGKFLKVEKSTVYAWIHQKKKTGIPVRHHGRRVIFVREELKAWSDSKNAV